MAVILRSKVGAISLSTDFGGREVKFNFNEKNEFTCELPTRVESKDTWGKVHLIHENYAQHILNDVKDKDGNNVFEIAEIKEAPVVTAPVTKGRPKKEKQNE
jgi:hypothetical protein